MTVLRPISVGILPLDSIITRSHVYGLRDRYAESPVPRTKKGTKEPGQELPRTSMRTCSLSMSMFKLHLQKKLSERPPNMVSFGLGGISVVGTEGAYSRLQAEPEGSLCPDQVQTTSVVSFRPVRDGEPGGVAVNERRTGQHPFERPVSAALS